MNSDKDNRFIRSYKLAACSIILVGSLASVPALSGSTASSAEKSASESSVASEESIETELHEAWMEGKIDTTFMLNRHLNNFTIDPEVTGGKVTLKGTVSSDVDRDLAEEIALSIDGIEEVDNKLEVVSDEKQNSDGTDANRGFADRIEDATLTAEVKVKLLSNSNTEGLDIDVDTVDRVVTLHGEVASEAKKALAEKIAANVDGVKNVVNKLAVQS